MLLEFFRGHPNMREWGTNKPLWPWLHPLGIQVFGMWFSLIILRWGGRQGSFQVSLNFEWTPGDRHHEYMFQFSNDGRRRFFLWGVSCHESEAPSL